MPMTPESALAAYVTPVQVFGFYARSLIADMLKATPDAPRPSYLAMIDSANPANQRFQVALKKGAGEIEAFCSIAKRYSPDDLQALTGVSLTLLQGLNAARGLWALYTKLKPGTARPEECPGAVESMELLHELRDGECIFGFSEAMSAGLPSVQPPNPNMLVTPNVVSRANRLFVNFGTNSWPNRDD